MAFRREVDDGVDVMVGDELRDERGVANVAFHQCDIGHVGDIGRVAGIGQRVQHDDAVIGRHLAPVADEVRADETRASGNDQIGHAPTLSLPR